MEVCAFFVYVSLLQCNLKTITGIETRVDPAIRRKRPWRNYRPWRKMQLLSESVDSLCRDGTDTPIKCNSSEIPNAAPISPFRNITWPTSVSRHANTLKGAKIHRYNAYDIRETAKTPIFRLLTSITQNRFK